MRTLITFSILALIAGSGCVGTGAGRFQLAYAVPVRPQPGFIYEHYKAPVQTNVDETELGLKVGRAQVRYIREPIITFLPIISWGDASVELAAKNGGITEIRHIDYEVVSVLYTFIEFTVLVYGN